MSKGKFSNRLLYIQENQLKQAKSVLPIQLRKNKSDVEDFNSLDDDYAEDGRDVVLNEIRSLTDDEEY